MNDNGKRAKRVSVRRVGHGSFVSSVAYQFSTSEDVARRREAEEAQRREERARAADICEALYGYR